MLQHLCGWDAEVLLLLCSCRFLPSDDLADQEAQEAQGGPESEEILFVFQRVMEEEEEEEEEEEPEPEEVSYAAAASLPPAVCLYYCHKG